MTVEELIKRLREIVLEDPKRAQQDVIVNDEYGDPTGHVDVVCQPDVVCVYGD